MPKRALKWLFIGTIGVVLLAVAGIALYAWPQAKLFYQVEQILANQDYPANSPFVDLKVDAHLRLAVVTCLARSARHDISLGLFMSAEETTQKLKSWLASKQGAQSLADCYNDKTPRK